MIVVFMGIQGSGKGTQARLLEQKLGLKHLDVGEIFRDHIKNNTELGLIFRTFTDKGQLVPDEYVIRMIAENEQIRHPENGCVLDGFPRSPAQAEFLLKNVPVARVFYFDLRSDKVASERVLGRLTCGHCGQGYNLKSKPPRQDGICDLCGSPLARRSDDNPAAIEERLKAFHKVTEPLLAMFEARNLVSRMDAQRDPLIIHRDILFELGVFAR